MKYICPDIVLTGFASRYSTSLCKSYHTETFKNIVKRKISCIDFNISHNIHDIVILLILVEVYYYATIAVILVFAGISRLSPQSDPFE